MALPARIKRPTSGGLSRTFYEAKLRRRSRSLTRRCTLLLVVFLGALVVVYEFMWTYWLAGLNIPNVEHDAVTGQDRVRRRPDLSTKYDPSDHRAMHTNTFDAIMEGFFTLVDIQIPPEGLISSGNEAYTNVHVSFCQLSWSLQQQNPVRVPLFENLRERSLLCPETMVTADLFAIARQAEQYDAGTNKFAATTKPRGFQVVPPTAVIFHEGHAGSTMTASILATSDPKHLHVYSEAPATTKALLACDNGVYCDAGAQEKLIQDVFYLLCRMNRPDNPQHVFFKVASSAVRSIDVFRKALPTVPWVFLYRNSLEVMAGHLQNYQESAFPIPDQHVPDCVRDRYNSWQHPQLLDLLNRNNRTLASLTSEDYCAAHLASLAQSALTENDKTSAWAKHMFVNYEDLPYILWDRIIPDMGYMSQPVSLRIDAMHDASKYYSAAHGGSSQHTTGDFWQEDASLKQGQATDATRQAAHTFLDPVYTKMEAIRLRHS